MCGFVGFIYKKNILSYENNISILNSMAQSIKYRGPDDTNNWVNIDKTIFCSHNRLSIQDLSINGKQPMISENKRWVLLFNGEIYNHNYLRGRYLHCHLDRVETHIISCVINVAQKVDKKWPLHIEDHNGKMHKIGLNPGEMIFYESCKLLHGRPDPLEGDFYSSIFVHYTPVDWDVVE